ncbi:MAG: thiolase family protein [Lachnospiraceae bacterium]|nr:thiolase family protein [Lachnospiraceae bacterium]
MKNVVIVDGLRTPFGRLGGGLRQFYPSELCGMTIRALVEKSGIMERGKVDSVFMGSAAGDAHCTNLARYAVLYSGLPYEVPASFVEMQCGSAIDALNHAAWKILTGNADVMIAGGGESYSQRAAKFSMAVEPYRLIPPTALPNTLSPNKDEAIDMVSIANLMAERWNVTREECDEFALRSQTLAKQAMDSGWLDDQIFPVKIPATRKTPETVVARDEQPRATTAEALAALKPVKGSGVTTAGNSSGLNDGASAVLLMTEEKAKELGYEPLAFWRGSAEYGVNPRYMGIAPAYSNLKLMDRFGLKPEDIAVYECNEAFAAQNLSVIKEMEARRGGRIDREKWNPHGGAIAFGHPNGASGTRITMHAMKHLRENGGGYGLVSSCCGGGLGVSCLLEVR